MKNTRALRLLLCGNAVLQFSQGICMIAIPWYYTDILKQPSAFGVMYAIATVATIFWNPLAGTLIDRYPRKRIFMMVAFFTGLTLLLSSFVGYQSGAIPSFFIVLVFTATLFNFNIHYPNLYAFAQEITQKGDYKRVNTYLEIQGQITLMIAGAMAAVLVAGVDDGILKFLGISVQLPFSIEAWSLQKIFMLNAITYFLAVIVVSFIKYVPAAERQIEMGSVLKRFKTGISFLKQNPMIFVFGNASYSIFVTVLIGVIFIFPMYVSHHLHANAQVYASSEIFFAFGAVLAGLSMQLLFKKINTVKAIITMMFITTLIFGLGYCTKSVFIFYMICLLLGLSNAGTRILRVTYLFNHISNDIIGRSNSVFAVINIILRSIFLIIFSIPFITNSNNVIYAMLILGCFAFISGLVLVIYYRKMEKN
ncbi:MAG: hypothetical protein COC01_03525 [Bacteroidetes bacterium]|nr:MFS transporter [Sphingobacteriaceae bacterium AH-315-L07]PCH68573.1 MAG: hypothetical protein COC01_03525 [Bacteroidota bacterium]